jgi:hypothetical protein
MWLTRPANLGLEEERGKRKVEDSALEGTENSWGDVNGWWKEI